MWQRARITPECDRTAVVGRLIWCTNYASPSESGGYNVDTRKYGYPKAGTGSMETNLLSPNTGNRLALPMICLEMLPEFADDVPLIPFEQWLKEK